MNAFATHHRLLVLLLAALVALPACKRGDPDPEPDRPEAEGTAEIAGDEAEANSGSGAAPPQAGAQPTLRVDPRADRPNVEESRELAAALGLAPLPPLVVADLLTRADVRELTGFRGELLETSLEGIDPGPSYNTIRLAADGGYGLALQVWQFEEARQLSNHFRRLRETYFDARLDPAGVANEAFSAEFQGLRHYAFLHRPGLIAAVVTCESAICDGSQARLLAQRVANRL